MILGVLAVRLRALHGLLHRPALVPVGRRLERVHDAARGPGSGCCSASACSWPSSSASTCGSPTGRGRCSASCRRSRRASSATAWRLDPLRRVAAHRHPCRARPARRRERDGRVEDLAAVAQRHRLRRHRPAVRAWTCRSTSSRCRSCASCSASCSRPSCSRFIAALVVHYVYGGIRLQPADDRFSRAAQAHLVGARRHLHAAQGGGVLARPLRAHALDRRLRPRHHLQGRQRGAARAHDPRVRLAVLRAAVLRQRVPRGHDHRGRRASCCSSARALVIGTIYPAFVQSVQVKPTELAARDAVHPEQHRRDASVATASTRPRSCSTPRRTFATEAAVKASVGHDREHPAARPGDRVARRTRRCRRSATYYRFPDSLDIDRYQLDGKQRGTVDRRPRAQPRRHRRQPAQLGQRPHRLHPRLRRGGGVRQHLQRAASRRSSSRTCRRRGCSTSSSRASTSARTPRRTRSSAAPEDGAQARARLPDATTGQAELHLHRHGRHPDRLAAQPAAVRGEVPGAQHRALGPHQPATRASSRCATRATASRRSRRGSRSTATPTPRSSTAGSSGWSTATPRPTPTPTRRRPRSVTRPTDTVTQRGVERRDAVAQPGQLHPQLGQGHGRRLRRHRHALRVGHHRPGAPDLDEGVPRTSCSRARRCRRASSTTSATPRTSSRCSARSSRSTT